jgi:hypothetical protein
MIMIMIVARASRPGGLRRAESPRLRVRLRLAATSRPSGPVARPGCQPECHGATLGRAGGRRSLALAARAAWAWQPEPSEATGAGCKAAVGAVRSLS